MLNSEQQTLLKYYGELIVTRLHNDILQKRVTKYGAVNASGDLAKSVRYEVDSTGLRVYANDYIYYLVHGRKPGKFPPKDVLIEWVQLRNFAPDLPMNQRTFLAGRSMKEKGTTAWIQGGTDLIDDVINDTLIREITQAFADDYIKQIKSEILNAYRIAA